MQSLGLLYLCHVLASSDGLVHYTFLLFVPFFCFLDIIMNRLRSAFSRPIRVEGRIGKELYERINQTVPSTGSMEEDN
jgi:hypothetical protein